MSWKKVFIVIFLIGLLGIFFLQKNGKGVEEFSYDSAPRTQPVRHLVIHSFISTPHKMLEIMYQAGLSVHYVIGSDGTMNVLVPENRVAWHAGPSFWAGQSGLNATSVGIELEHSDYGQTDYPKEQMQVLTKLAKEIIDRHHIPPENIVGHSDIAPDGKQDPGQGFPWKKMSEEGIGLWYDLKNADKLSDLTVSELLSIIGYPVQGRLLKASCWAFRQRFMPETIPYDDKIAERGEAMYQARQRVGKLPPKEREEILKNTPAIFPPDQEACLTTQGFIKTLRAVAYEYQQARKRYED